MQYIMNKTASSFEIKSTRMDVLVVDLKDPTIERISAGLHQRFSKMSDASSVPLLLDLSLFKSQEDFDIDKILTLFKYYGLKVIGIRHTNNQFESLAKSYKLSFNLVPKKSTSAITPQETKPDLIKKETPPNGLSVQIEPTHNQKKQSLVADPVSDVKPAEGLSKDTGMDSDNKNTVGSQQPPEKIPTMIISRPVRTGQQVYAKNADLIVLDLVSPGAEVLADGNIHVYAPLRGRALAGVSGNRQARVFTQCMQAELVSIAGVYRTMDQGLPQDIANKPAQIYIEQNKLVIKTLK